MLALYPGFPSQISVCLSYLLKSWWSWFHSSHADIINKCKQQAITFEYRKPR